MGNKNIAIDEKVHYELDVFATKTKKTIKEVAEKAITYYIIGVDTGTIKEFGG